MFYLLIRLALTTFLQKLYTMNEIYNDNISTHMLIMRLHKIENIQKMVLSYSFRKSITFFNSSSNETSKLTPSSCQPGWYQWLYQFLLALTSWPIDYIPRSIGILVGYSFRISTQQLGCCYGIDFWKVAGIFPVSLVTALCHLIFI